MNNHADEPHQIVNEQAEDEGLWFMTHTAPEAYLQQALRRLHVAVETACTVDEPRQIRYGLNAKCSIHGSNHPDMYCPDIRAGAECLWCGKSPSEKCDCPTRPAQVPDAALEFEDCRTSGCNYMKLVGLPCTHCYRNTPPIPDIAPERHYFISTVQNRMICIRCGLNEANPRYHFPPIPNAEPYHDALQQDYTILSADYKELLTDVGQLRAANTQLDEELSDALQLLRAETDTNAQVDAANERLVDTAGRDGLWWLEERDTVQTELEQQVVTLKDLRTNHTAMAQSEVHIHKVAELREQLGAAKAEIEQQYRELLGDECRIIADLADERDAVKAEVAEVENARRNWHTWWLEEQQLKDTALAKIEVLSNVLLDRGDEGTRVVALLAERDLAQAQVARLVEVATAFANAAYAEERKTLMDAIDAVEEENVEG